MLFCTGAVEVRGGGSLRRRRQQCPPVSNQSRRLAQALRCHDQTIALEAVGEGLGGVLPFLESTTLLLERCQHSDLVEVELRNEELVRVDRLEPERRER